MKETQQEVPTTDEFILQTCEQMTELALSLAEMAEALRIACASQSAVGGDVSDEKAEIVRIAPDVEVSYLTGKPLPKSGRRDRRTALKRAEIKGRNLKDFSTRVAYLRASFFRGSRGEFGEVIGVSGECIRHWEWGTSFPNDANLSRLERMTTIAFGAPEFWSMDVQIDS